MLRRCLKYICQSTIGQAETISRSQLSSHTSIALPTRFNRFLSAFELRGPHSGENIAEVVGEVLQDYSIMPGQIGRFTLDNAANNDTCITALAKTYEWGKDEVYTRRLRCFDHSINLIAQAFLFGSDSEVLRIHSISFNDR